MARVTISESLERRWYLTTHSFGPQIAGNTTEAARFTSSYSTQAAAQNAANRLIAEIKRG